MGRFCEYVKMAVQNICANKGRSILTMLGIIIGIASVIAIVAIGAGTKNEMNNQIDGVGAGQIMLNVSDDGANESVSVTKDDITEIRKLDCVDGVNISESYSGESVTGKGTFSIILTGEGPDAEIFNNSDMKYGNYFNENDIEENRNVCVLSDTDAKSLFGTSDVVGLTLDVSCLGVSKTFKIAGVTTPKETSKLVSYDYDDNSATVRVPYSAMEDIAGNMDEFYSITIMAKTSYDSKDVSDQVVHLLEQRHQCAGEKYYEIQSYQDFASTMNDMLEIVTLFISFVAGISLLVGGIGVMNIMLVSVTERTREIGIRKSLGAKTSSITMQFLAEAAILTVIGGIIGIIFGILAAYVACAVMSDQMGANITPGISLQVIAVATLFSCAVGIFFGIYPAKKAAKLSPIEALRST